MKKMNDKKGFTLMEMLIVVAIIAVLVAIAIPVFTTELEKSREATDAANLRAAYAEVMVAGITEDEDNYSKPVTAKQTQANWQNTTIDNIGGLAVGNDANMIPASTDGWTVTFDAESATVTIEAN